MMPSKIATIKPAVTNESAQLQQYRFYKKRMFETRLCLGIGLLAALILVIIWHLNLQHKIKLLTTRNAAVPIGAIDSKNTLEARSIALKQYRSQLQTIQERQRCATNLFNDLQQQLPQNIVLSAIKLHDQAWILHGSTKTPAAISKLLQKIAVTKRYQQQLLEIKNADAKMEVNNNFTIEIRCVEAARG